MTLPSSALEAVNGPGYGKYLIAYLRSYSTLELIFVLLNVLSGEMQ